MAEAIGLQFTSPSGEATVVEWRLDRLAEGAARTVPAWRIEGEIDWDEVEAIRVLSGRLEDGRLLVAAAVRPAGAAGHGEELVSGALGEPGAVEELAEVLLSSERGADGAIRRVGAELYGRDDEIPQRLAADAAGTTSRVEGGLRHEHATLALRLDGTAGAGSFDVLRPA